MCVNNMIVIDCLDGGRVFLETRDGEDAIEVVVFDGDEQSGHVELFYGDNYHEEWKIKNNVPHVIPREYYSDPGNLHIRYIDDNNAGPFYHILGNACGLFDIRLVPINKSVYVINGIPTDKKSAVNYMVMLAKLISTHTNANEKDCYIDLKTIQMHLVDILDSYEISASYNETVEKLVDKVANINNISSGSVLSGLTTYESRCPSINEYVIPSGGYAYMVAQGFAELAELLGLRWDASSNTMYAGNNVDYGFRFMQTGQTSFGIMTKKVPQASDAANYVVTCIDVGHSIIYARCKDGVVFGHYKNGSDNYKYNLHWVVTKYKNLNDGSQKYAYFYPSINTADSTIITEDGEQIGVLMHSRYNTNSGASTSYIQMYQICTEQGYLLNNAYVTSNYPTDNYDDKEYAYEFEMNGKKYIQIQFVMNSSFESYCIELE